MNDVAIDRLQRVLGHEWPGPAPDPTPGRAALAAPWTDCPLSLNVRGTIVWAGPATREVLGWSPEDLAGSHFSVLTSRLGRDFLEAHLALVLAGGDVASLVDVGVKRDGRTFKAAITLEALRTGRGDVTGATVVLRDVTAAHRQRRAHDLAAQARSRDALRLSGALHRAMVETAEEGIAVVAADGTTRYANAALAGVLGIPLEQVYATATATLLRTAPDGTPTPRRHEVVHAHPDGTDRVLEVTRSPLDLGEGAGSGELLVVADVTETRREERALRRRALYDPLTGLPNRYLFRDRLEMAAARQARTEGDGTAVLFLDLDRFKPVNDTHGHDVGDELLQGVATRLAGAVRATDTVARHGGDEFVIICEDIDETAVRSVAARIQAAFGAPIRLGAGDVPVSISVGVALSPPYAIDELVRQADAAMYHAKEQGGGRSAVAHRDGAVVVPPQEPSIAAADAQLPSPRAGELPTS